MFSPGRCIRTDEMQGVPKKWRQNGDKLGIELPMALCQGLVLCLEMARLAGFEPATLGSEDRCSIH